LHIVIHTQLKQNTMTPHVPQEILRQLGGSKFIAMTGSKNFVYDSKTPYYLSMHLSRNKARAQYLKIELNGLDLYNVTFSKLVNNEIVTVKSFENVYDDMLQSIFTEVTGLNTHL
jgi:hypothetical protein